MMFMSLILSLQKNTQAKKLNLTHDSISMFIVMHGFSHHA